MMADQLQDSSDPEPLPGDVPKAGADAPKAASEPSPSVPAATARRGPSRWILYTGVVVLCVLAALGAHRLLVSGPSAQASVLVTPLIGNPYSPSSASLLNIETEVQLVTADEVSAAAAEAVGTPWMAQELAGATSAQVVPGSQVVSIAHARDSEAAAQNGAQAFAEAYLAERRARAERSLEEQTSALRVAIAAAQKDLDAAVKAVNRAKPGSTDRQLAQQALNVASVTVASRTDELSALRATSVDAGQVIALDSESSDSPVWIWALAGLVLASLVVLVLHVAVQPKR